MFGFKKRQTPVDEAIIRSMDIIADYGEYLERHPVTLEIVDESALPHKKRAILDAICMGLLIQPNTELREALMTAALSLANFQPNTGTMPLYPHGVDLTASKMHDLSPQELMNRYECGIEEGARYDALRPHIRKEVHEIGERIKEANRTFNEMHRGCP